MKKVIVATSQSQAKAKAKTILNYGKKLLDAMENTPSGFLDANDLGSLYEELIETLPALDFMIKDDSLEY